MEIWFMIIVTASITALLNAFLSVSKPNSNLPPGPRSVPILSTILWLRKSSFQMEQTLRKQRSRFGPIVTIHVGSRPLIFISDGTLAHQALIQLGPVFADRPKQPLTGRIMSSNQHSINTAGYGPTWHLLRRNLNSEILQPSKSKEFSTARKWALEILLSHLKQDTSNNSVLCAVKVIDHFRFSMFCLLVFMCFGDKMDESVIREVKEVVYRPMVLFNSYQILNFWPWMTRVLLRSRWDEFINSRKKQEEVLIPCIAARKHSLQDSQEKVNTCYVDSLLELELSEDGIVKRKLSEGEIVTLCTEFLTGGTDTTSTALQWIMSSQGEFDITGSREIKMMPFGAGKRMCPASGLALLHLQYFVANLVCKFEWTVAQGKEVDLAEKQEFTNVMKNPLEAHISPRLLGFTLQRNFGRGLLLFYTDAHAHTDKPCFHLPK